MTRSRTALFVLLAIALGMSFAGRSQATSRDFITSPEIGVAPPLLPTAACVLGETRLPNLAVSNYMVTGSTFYELIDPALCTVCPVANGLAVSQGFIQLRYLAAASITLEVSLVEAVDPACPHPDPSQVVCGPNQITLASAVATPFANLALPLGQTCCITHRVFLRVKVLTVSDPHNIAFAHNGNPCFPCQSYVDATFTSGITDGCAVIGANHKLWVEADCCAPTGALRGTWGRMKSIYR